MPAAATAVGDRSAQFLVSIDSTWQQPEVDARNIAYTRGLHDELLPHSDARSSVHFASGGGDAPPDRVREIKAKYDPDGVFQVRSGQRESPARRRASQVPPEGIEPSTFGLRVRCSAS